MGEILGDRMVQFALALAVLAALVGVAAYLIGRMRKAVTATTISANEHLSNFREMHSQGELSDEEYRTIKAMLAEPLKQQLQGDAKRK